MNVAPTEFKFTFFIFVVLFNSENFSRPEMLKNIPTLYSEQRTELEEALTGSHIVGNFEATINEFCPNRNIIKQSRLPQKHDGVLMSLHQTNGYCNHYMKVINLSFLTNLKYRCNDMIRKTFKLDS